MPIAIFRITLNIVIERSLAYPQFNCGVRDNFSSFILDKKDYSNPDDNCLLKSFQLLSKKTPQNTEF